MAAINCTLKGYKELTQKIKKMEQQAEKDLNGAIRSVRKVATRKIADDISKRYNVKKSEINSGKIVTAKVKAKPRITIIEYKGRLLTLPHFKGYGPKKPGELLDERHVIPGAMISFKGSAGPVATVRNRKAVSVKAEIIKGKKVKITLGAFVAPAAKGSQTYIPFQRTGSGRGAIEAIKTLSVPQMITNEDVAKDIIEHIGGSVSKEVEKRALKWL